MAKLTTLELVNDILRNCGERSDLSSLTSLSGIQNVVWNKLIEALNETCSDGEAQWQFLEDFGEVPLATGQYRYLISGLASGSDMQREDPKSFTQADSGNKIVFKTPQEWDELFPNGIQTSSTGYPTMYTKFGGYIIFDKYATAAENGDIVSFRYWRHPTYPATGSPSATLDVPEPFDRLVLSPLATMKTLIHLGNEEAVAYKLMVYGDGRDIEGNISKMQRMYASPYLKTRLSLSAK